MRERLIELINQARKKCRKSTSCKECSGYCKGPDCISVLVADLLLADGWMRPPCKVGDTVYRISTKSHSRLKYIQETTISRIAIDNEGIWLFCSCNPIARCIFGKTVFLTREEAEAALKEGAE